MYMIFAGWEARMVKNYDRELENAARGLFTPDVTVFHHTDRPKPENNITNRFVLYW